MCRLDMRKSLEKSKPQTQQKKKSDNKMANLKYFNKRGYHHK